jgi:hypothetical protein
LVDDKFGIRHIYQSKSNGQEWYLGDDAEGDNRFDTRGDSISGNENDGFCTSESDFRYHILTTKGQKDGGKDHQEWIDRGYISYPEDWRNFEIGGEFKYDGSDDWSLYGRAWRHTGSGNCEGTKYSVAFNPDGETRWSKETYHNEGYDQTDWTNMGIGSMDNVWVRVKFICYDLGKVKEGPTDWVRLEIWADKDKNNSWKKIKEFTDTGENWGQGGRKCGTSEQATFMWGGPFITIRGDSTNKFCFRKVSAREIVAQPAGTGGGGSQDPVPPNQGGNPPSNPPGGGAPQIEPGSIGKDKFGIHQLLPSPTGGFQWFNNWDTGGVFSNVTPPSPYWTHPSDPYMHVEDIPGMKLSISAGILQLTHPADNEKDYRIEIFDETDKKRWVNIEATVYYYWDAIDYNNPNQGGYDRINIGSDHHFPVKACAYNAHEYTAETRRDGKIFLNKEPFHYVNQAARPNPDWDKAGSEIWWDAYANNKRPPLNTWIGFKFIKQLMDAGKNVRLQLYRDLTDGLNGGTWEKIMEWKHIEGNWLSQVEEENTTAQALMDQSHSNINDCRIAPPTEGNDPVFAHSGGMCHLRGTPITSIKFKKVSFREVIDADTPLPDQQGRCPPGFRNNNGVCIPSDGSGGSGGSGESGIVFKDWFFVYHIGSTDADSCDISGLFSSSGADIAYEVTSGDITYDLYAGGKTNAGIFIASNGSKLWSIAPKKIRVFLSKFGLPTGTVLIHANDENGKHMFEFGRIAADLLTPTPEEYEFEIKDNKIALQTSWAIWISYLGGDPENFVRVEVKTGNPADGNNTTAIRFGPQSGREQIDTDDICAIVYR